MINFNRDDKKEQKLVNIQKAKFNSCHCLFMTDEDENYEYGKWERSERIVMNEGE